MPRQELTGKTSPAAPSTRLSLLASIYSLLMPFSPLNAEERENIYSLSLEALLAIEIVGPTLTPEDQKTVPASVTVFTHAQIKVMGFDSLSELMNVAPGFQSYRSSVTPIHYPFSSRGWSNGLSSSEILVLMDGHRLNSYNNSDLSLISSLPINNIERVEFIRGPGAAIYGANAMTGVINITTRKEAHELSVNYGDNNHGHINLLSNHKLGDVNVDFFAKKMKDKGSSYSVIDTTSKDRIQKKDPLDLTDLSLKAQRKGSQLHIYHRQLRGDEFFLGGKITKDYESQQVASLSFMSLKQEFKWLNVDSWALLSYSRSKRNLASQLISIQHTPPPNSPPLKTEIEYSGYEYRVQLHNSWTINSSDNLQFGLEFQSTKSPESQLISYYMNTDDTALLLREKSERDSIGSYIQHQSNPFSSSRLTIGGRYDYFLDIDSKFSPRIGWVQDIGESQTIKLLYGEAFRVPSDEELNTRNTGAITSNPDLKPETLKNLDLIWLVNWPTTSASISYFENRFEDSITQDVTNGNITYINSTTTERSRGLEVEVTQEAGKQLLIQGSFTHVRDKPESSFSEASQFGSLSLNYHQGHWNANIIASYHGTRDTVIENTKQITLNDYWLTFGKLSYSPSSRWETYLQIKNLTDKIIKTPPSLPRALEPTPDRDRELRLGLTINW